MNRKKPAPTVHVLLAVFLLLCTGCRPDPAVRTSNPGKTASPPPVRRREPVQPAASPSPRMSSSPDLEAQIALFEKHQSAVDTTVATTRKKPPKSALSDLPLKLPSTDKPSTTNDSELSMLRDQAEYSGAAADWRKVAERALEVQDFSTAHLAFAEEARIYREKGHIQAALAEEIKAAQYETTLEFYLSETPSSDRKLQRLEPASGCMAGAFIDRDFNLETLHYDSQTHGNIEDFNRLTKKKARQLLHVSRFRQAVSHKLGRIRQVAGRHGEHCLGASQSGRGL